MKSLVERRRQALVVAVLLSAAGCAHPKIQPTATQPPGPAQMAEFWIEPADLASRDLYWGAGGSENAPDPAGRFWFLSRDSKGYSKGYEVRDDRGLVWSVKLGDEAQSEVVSSRLLWALGFHQPPAYHVEKWTLSGQTTWAGPQSQARFRPDLPGMKKVGDWSWHQNPFVGTPPWRGGLVMMVLLNNSDLKPSQNAIYELERPREGAQRWYVVRDLGLSLGRTGLHFPPRNNITEFEHAVFIVGVEGGKVKFNYSGRWKELFRDLTPADVRWTCERLARLTPRQWDEAFRAAHYRPEVAERFIRRFQQKIAQGLSLETRTSSRP